jgi:hypothetical protein
LPIEFFGKKREIESMLQDPPSKKEYNDDWQTSAREGYEDRGAFRPQRSEQKKQGSSILRTLGSMSIVGGIFWGVYVVTHGGNAISALQENHGPIAIIALGVISSILGKFLRV